MVCILERAPRDVGRKRGMPHTLDIMQVEYQLDIGLAAQFAGDIGDGKSLHDGRPFEDDQVGMQQADEFVGIAPGADVVVIGDIMHRHVARHPFVRRFVNEIVRDEGRIGSRPGDHVHLDVFHLRQRRGKRLRIMCDAALEKGTRAEDYDFLHIPVCFI